MEFKENAGFTLIEVLVSIVILSLLIAIASFGLSLFLDNWGKDRLERRHDIPEMARTILLKDAVEGCNDYFVKMSRDVKDWVPYFRTYEDGFGFITENPIFGEEGMAVARLVFRQEGEFYSLMYEESSLTDKYLDYFDEPVHYPRSIQLFKDIRSFSLSYFGARHISTAGLFANQLESTRFLPEMNMYDWFRDYNGPDRRILPKQIKISMNFADGKEKTFVFFIRVWDLAKPNVFNALQTGGF